MRGAIWTEQQNVFDLQILHKAILQSLELQGCIDSCLKFSMLEQLDLAFKKEFLKTHLKSLFKVFI